MSTIAVNAITDANDGNTTTINGVTPNVNNVVGKNLIINGAMQIAQRGTSTTGVTTAGYFACDRFYYYVDSIGTWTVSQDTDAPDGFGNSLKISCTTADASPAAGDRVNLQHRIEGQFLQHLAKGTTSAKKVTLSFWMKSNKTGNMQVNLYDNDNNRFVSGTVTINSSATWEKKSITFVGDTVSGYDNDNNLSLIIEWWLDSGTTWSSGTSPTTWQSNSAADRNANGTLALADSTSNYINITGVQLEVGELATEFEHRPYGTELALCQRYLPALLAVASTDTLGLAQAYSTSGSVLLCNFPVQARTTATGVTISSVSHVGGWRALTNVAGSPTAVTFTRGGTNSAFIDCSGWTGALAAGDAMGVYWTSTDGKLLFTGCEL